jgi:hypothetical protein
LNTALAYLHQSEHWESSNHHVIGGSGRNYQRTAAAGEERAVTAAVRKVVSFAGVAALFIGAAYWLYFARHEAAWYPLWFLAGPPLLTLVAAYWLWEKWRPRTSTQKSQYAKEVDEHLRVMLAGFEPRLVEGLKERVNLDVLVTESERAGTSAQACAIYAAAALLDRAVEQLGEQGRSAVLEAFERKDETDKMYVGVVRLLATVERFDVEAPLKRMLIYGVIGRLKGGPRDQMHSWW